MISRVLSGEWLDWKKRFAALCVLLVALLLLMALPRLSALSTGESVLLETMPRDPRSLLSGDYVILNYRIGTLRLADLGLPNAKVARGDDVFVSLAQNGKYWEPVAVSVGTRPEAVSGRVVIAGKAQGPAFPNQRGAVSTVSVKYGIEEYYIPEGTGRKYEDRRMRIDVHARVTGSGFAAIDKVELVDAPPPPPPAPPIEVRPAPQPGTPSPFPAEN